MAICQLSTSTRFDSRTRVQRRSVDISADTSADISADMSANICWVMHFVRSGSEDVMMYTKRGFLVRP